MLLLHIGWGTHTPINTLTHTHSKCVVSVSHHSSEREREGKGERKREGVGGVNGCVNATNYWVFSTACTYIFIYMYIYIRLHRYIQINIYVYVINKQIYILGYRQTQKQPSYLPYTVNVAYILPVYILLEI